MADRPKGRPSNPTVPDHLNPDRRLARERVRARLPRTLGFSPSVSLQPHVLHLLFLDADRAERLAEEVAFYRSRLPRGAWYPKGEPLPTDPPDPEPPDPRPRIDL